MSQFLDWTQAEIIFLLNHIWPRLLGAGDRVASEVESRKDEMEFTWQSSLLSWTVLEAGRKWSTTQFCFTEQIVCLSFTFPPHLSPLYSTSSFLFPLCCLFPPPFPPYFNCSDFFSMPPIGSPMFSLLSPLLSPFTRSSPFISLLLILSFTHLPHNKTRQPF